MVPVLLALAAAVPLAGHAQTTRGTLDGAWQAVFVRVVSPDSTYTLPPGRGMVVFHAKFYSQLWETPVPGVQQQAVLSTAEEKAARYDQLAANVGTFEVKNDSLIQHYTMAKVPRNIGRTARFGFRLAGDTLWTSTDAPWAKDTTKVVRTNITFVRLR